jgi:hypothetical protein
MIRVSDLREHVIRPTLKLLNMGSLAAENLLLGTCAQESRLGTYLKQRNGPALGIYQIEPATHDDLWKNFISFHPDLLSTLMAINHYPRYESLVTDLSYATAIARLVYYRAPEKLPDANDVEGLAAYWKAHYNTPLGKGTVKEFIDNYNSLVLGISHG